MGKGEKGKKGREKETEPPSTKRGKRNIQRKKKPKKEEIFRTVRENLSFLSVIGQNCFFQILFPAP